MASMSASIVTVSLFLVDDLFSHATSQTIDGSIVSQNVRRPHQFAPNLLA